MPIYVGKKKVSPIMVKKTSSVGNIKVENNVLVVEENINISVEGGVLKL